MPVFLVMFYAGKDIVQRLKDNIVLVCVDEAHASLPSQWGHKDMREDMNIDPSYLRAQVMTSTKAPTLAMTASAKVKGDKKHKSEVDQIKSMCAIQHSETSVITISPILHNHIYVSLRSPPPISGFYGPETQDSPTTKIGLVHLLWRIYLKYFVTEIKANRTPKRAIIYVKKMNDLVDLDEFLTMELEHLDVVRNPNTCPWVVSSSASGRITTEKIRERAGEEDSSIHLFITTSVMLFGLNLKDVSMVILLSPFHSLNSILQAGGRAGRRQGNGRRTKSVIYTLYNGTDLRPNTPIEKSVREFCTSTSCLKQKMNFYFSNSSSIPRSDTWCCSVCSFPK